MVCGVWLFFVLSSFLLSLYFFENPRRMLVPLEWANYAVRRFARIYPLYTAAVLYEIAFGTWRMRALPELLLLQAPSYWAVYVEFRFYFLLPFLVPAVWLAGRLHRFLPPVLMLAGLAVHYRFFPDGTTVLGYEPWKQVDKLFPEYIIVFAAGVFTAWLYVQTADVRGWLARTGVADAAALVLLAVVLLALPGVGRQIGLIGGWSLAPDYYHYQWVPWSLLLSVLVYMAAAADGPARALFASGVMRFFGFISYSLYMSMDFVLQHLEVFTDPLFFLIVAMACTAAVAWGLFMLVERPLSRLSLLRGRQTQKVGGVAEVRP